MPANSLKTTERDGQLDQHRPANEWQDHGRLPLPLTPFVGRLEEVASAIALLQRDDVRILTLTGPGGAGKTRMAIEIARRAALDYPDGVSFVELAEINEAERLMPAIAHVFRIPEIGEHTPQAIVEQFIGDRRILLVLDNFDQIVDAGPAVSELVRNCRHLKVLVTSRIVMNIQGEQELAVPPLSLPESGPGRTWRAPKPEELANYDAVSLFVQRARAARPEFELTADNSLAVIDVCRRLDGLPLAIELAAARTKILTPEALFSRLSRSLDILSGGARNLPLRLQTMRAAIAWSYELLDPTEQEILQILAVFAGGFTLEAAEAVGQPGSGAPDWPAGDVLAGIASLVDNSLLNRVESDAGEPRFIMLETIREFALEQLAESGFEVDARQRHANWVAAMAIESESRIFGPNDTATLGRLEIEHDNIRSALSWLLDTGQIETGMTIACWAWPLWLIHNYIVDGLTWLEALTHRAGEPRTSTYALARGLLAVLTEGTGDLQSALARAEEATAIARSLGDRGCLARCVLSLADVIEEMGDIDRAEPLFVESMALLRETGEEGWLVSALTNLTLLSHHRGDDDRAEALASEALEISRRIGFTWGAALSLDRQGLVVADSGDYKRATGLFQESLMLWNDVGDRWRIAVTFSHLADAAAQTGQMERAARLLGTADAINELLMISSSLADNVGWHRARRIVTEKLDPETFERIWNEGRQLPWADAITYATDPVTADGPDVDVAGRAVRSESPLSPRETEVLQLLIAGQTDREIAEALFISPRTAQGHVASIFNKLGVNSRTAAVAMALQSGLIPYDDSTP